MDCRGLPQGREGLPQEEGARFMEGEVSPRLRVQSCITLIPLFGTEGSLSAWTEYSDKFGKIILSDSSLATLMLHHREVLSMHNNGPQYISSILNLYPSIALNYIMIPIVFIHCVQIVNTEDHMIQVCLLSSFTLSTSPDVTFTHPK